MKKLERLEMIILCLKQKGKQTAEELANYLEVSKRTVYRDVEALSQMNIPIIAYEGVHGGYAIDESYFMPTVQLSDREVLILMLLLRMSTQLNLPDFTENINTLELKLRNACSQSHEKYTKALEHITVSIQNIYPKAYLSGAFEKILESFSYQVNLRIQYFSPLKNRVLERVISPLHLYYDEGCWYLDAYCHLRSKKRTFRLDRIISISIESEGIGNLLVKQYKEELLDDPKILLEFDIDKDLYNLIQYDSAMSKAAIIEERESMLRVKTETNRINYFETLAFRNWEQVTILKPQEMVHRLQEKLSNTLKKYQ